MANQDTSSGESPTPLLGTEMATRRVLGMRHLEARGFRVISWLAAIATVLSLIIMGVQSQGSQKEPFICNSNEQTAPTKEVSDPDDQVSDSINPVSEALPEAAEENNNAARVLSNICVDKKTAVSGEVLSYSIHAVNEGTTELSYDYVVFMTLDPRLSYVVGSSEFIRNGRRIDLTDNWTVTGVNLGRVRPGDDIYVTFKAQMYEGIEVGETMETVAQFKTSEEWTWRACAAHTSVKI